MPFKFEGLHVWRQAVDLTGIIHNVTAKFPKKELHILTSQIQRAADSVALNIAEGSTGQSNREYIKFLRYSIRSALEVVCCIYVARQRGIISEVDFNTVYEFTNTLVTRIQALIKSIR